MGGYGSGGHNRNGWAALENWPQLNIQDLKTSGLFKPGARATATIGDSIKLDISVINDTFINILITNQGSSYWQYIDFQKHPRPLGGYQAYFLCPDCARRCIKVCFFQGRLSCRKCKRLQYCSQRLRDVWRINQRARKVEARLRGVGLGECSRGLYRDVPPRPKGMHRRTYERLCEIFEQVETAASYDLVRRFHPVYKHFLKNRI